MNCELFIEKISLKLGAMNLDAEERVHLESCAECRACYESLLSLESSLDVYTPEPLSGTEIASFNDGLDEKIGRHLNRATGFYRLAVRYGVAVSAVFLLVFISIFSNKEMKENGTDTLLYYFSDYTGELELYDDTWVDDEYVEEAVGAFVRYNGIGSSELVVGELSAEELQYLENNLDVGGLL